jgi:sugar lactone lactonase YvrE
MGALALGLTVLGIAVPVRAQAVVTLSTQSFSLTKVGQSTTQTLTLSSGDDLAFNGYGLPSNNVQIDPASSEFTLGDALGNRGTCVSVGTVAAGSTCTIIVTFKPKLPGWSSAPSPISRSAPLIIQYVDTDLMQFESANFPVTGTGTGPVAAISPGLISDIVGNDAPVTPPSTSYAGDGGPASGAVFNSPMAMTIDSLGNIYIADTSNDLVRVVYKAGTQLSNLIALENNGTYPTAGSIYTIAGNTAYVGTPSMGTDGVLATQTTLANPQGVAVDAAGNIYISDTGNSAVRMINASTGMISTVAGTLGTGGLSDQVPATQGLLFYPAGIAVDGYGNIYISDSQNSALRVVYMGGTALAGLIATENPGSVSTPIAGWIYTIAGGTCGNQESDNGIGDNRLATQADLCSPSAVAVDSQGNLFISDTGDQALRRVDAVTGLIATVSAAGQLPAGLALDASDNLYYGTSNSCTVYEYNAQTKTAIAVAGNASCGVRGDGGSATNAGLSGAQGVTVDGAGNLHILEPDGVRFVNATATSIAFPYAQFGIAAPTQTVLIEDADIVNYAIGAPYVSTTTALAETAGSTGLTVASPFLVVAPAPAYLGSGGTVADCGSAAMNLTPGLTCGIGLSVEASADTTYTAAATYPENGLSGLPLNFSLSATVGGTAPAVSLTGGPLTFYAVPGGAASATQTLTLTNLSATAAVTITSIAATTGFTQTNTCGSRLAANGQCTINVSFTASALATVTGSLQIFDNSSTTGGTQSVALTGNGVYPTATLTGGPLIFTAILNESASAAQTLTLTNTSQVPLTITNIVPEPYRNVGDVFFENNTCVNYDNFSGTLPAGQSCTININFGPSATGTVTQTFTVTDNAGGAGATQTTQLTGNGVVPIATITQPTAGEINFGSLAPGNISAAMPVTIQNTGTAPLTFCMPSPACLLNASAGTSGVPFLITGVVWDQFFVDGTACLAAAPLAVGASCTLNVYFIPTFAGRMNATLNINDDSGGANLARGTVSTQTITLNGVGNVPVGGSNFNLANATQFLAAVGQTQTQTVTLTLNNAVALNSMNIQRGFLEFRVGAITGCAVDGVTVNPVGTICQIQVTFAPISPGIRTAPLIVTTTENGGTPYAFGLSGTGSGSLAVLTPGIITQFVGGYLGTSYTGIGGPANQAQVGFLNGMAIDSAGNLFLSDRGNNTIWRIDGTTSVINYYAGGPWPDYGPAFTDGGTAIDSNIGFGGPLALNAAGVLYLGNTDGWTGTPAPGHNLIRSIDPVNNIITSVAGNGVAGWPSHARVYPGGIIQFAIGSVNYLYTVQTGGVTGLVRPTFTDVVGATYQDGTAKWVNSGEGTTPGFGCPGQTDSIGDGCTGLNALLSNAIAGLVLDQAGDLYFSDGTMVRRIDAATGIVTIYAGNGTPGHTGDGGQATAAEIAGGDLAFDSNGNLYIAEAAAVRMVAGPSSLTPGVITTVAGNGTRNPGNNQGGTICAGGSGDGGPATAAEFSGLTGIAFDAANDLYLTDGSACRVRRVDSGTNTILTVAGAGGGYLSGSAATNFGNLGDTYDGGDGSAYGATLPQGVLTRLDGMGNMYIMELVNGVRKINVSQSVMDYNFVYAPNFMPGVDGNIPIDTEAGTPLTTTVLNAGNSGVLNFKKPFMDSPWGIGSTNWTRDITNPTGATDCYYVGMLADGTECPINTDFTPLADGSPLTGVTTVNDDAVNTPQTITLIGTAVGTPADVTLLPFLLSFSTPQNSSSAPQTLTLTNNNSTPVTFSISLAGVNMADFSLDTSKCSSPLAGNTSCPINVTFNPPLVGGNVDSRTPPDILTAQVVVFDSDANTPRLVSNLIGIGTVPTTATPIPLTITEMIDLSDAPTVVVPTPLTIVENIQLSDTEPPASNWIPLPLNILETIQLTDTLAPIIKAQQLNIPEHIHVTDTLAPILKAQQLNIPETIHVTDALTSMMLAQQLNIPEQIHVSDSIAPVPVPLTTTIQWPAPAPIVYGTSLSGLLNASAWSGTTSVPGSYAYTATPTGGSAATVTSSTVLAAGSYTLAVTFTPSIATEYTTATGTVSLTVNLLPPGLSLTFAGAVGSGTQTVLPGGKAVFDFIIAPVNTATFLDEVTLSVSGLPVNATYKFSPLNLPAGSGSTPVTLTIQLPQNASAIHHGDSLGRKLAPFALSLLLLPFAGRLRRAGKRLRRIGFLLLLLGSASAAVTALNGCGSTSGFFAQQQQSYTITVTGTSGGLSHSATVTLTVE